MTQIHRRSALVLAAAAALALASCESADDLSSLGSGGGSGGDSDADTDSDADSDTDSDADSDADADTDSDTDSGSGTVCEEQSFSVAYVPVKLMILLDMSGSMVIPQSKYDHAREAIQGWLVDYQGSFLFGFDSYPDAWYAQSCSVENPVWFDCAPDQEIAISSWLDTHAPQSGSGDPLVMEMDELLDDPAYAPAFMTDALQGDPYLLVVADGDDCCGPYGAYTCGNEWVAELVQRTGWLLQAGVKTMVIGYTENADEAALGAIAAAGGTEFDTFVPALDQAALEEALDAIASAIVSCSFEVEEPEATADPDNVNFYFDDVVVPFDDGCAAGEGWTWLNPEHTEVLFCEGACAQLQGGNVDLVSAKFGCPTVTVE